jgi:hypothetical protein
MMMMAHDWTPGPVALSEETIAAVRSALERYVGNSTDGDELRASLQTISSEARDKSIRAEQLLVVLKDVWYTLPGLRGTIEPTEQVRLLQRVVTMCIGEYYRN